MVKRQAPIVVLLHDRESRAVDRFLNSKSRGKPLRKNRLSYAQITIQTIHLPCLRFHSKLFPNAYVSSGLFVSIIMLEFLFSFPAADFL